MGLVLVVMLAACGGGDGGDDTTTTVGSGPGSTPSTVISTTQPTSGATTQPAASVPSGAVASATVSVEGKRLEFDFVEDPGAALSPRCEADVFSDFIANDTNSSGGQVVEGLSVILRSAERMEEGDHEHEFMVAWMDGGEHLYNIVPFDRLAELAPGADYVGEWTVEGTRVHGEVLLIETNPAREIIGSEPVTATFDIECPAED